MWNRCGDLHSEVNRLKLSEPEIPKETCPMIDEIVSFIDNLNGIDELVREKHLQTLEEIRKANATLRTLGLDWYQNSRIIEDKGEDIIKDCEKEREVAEDKIEDLEQKISGLEEEINNSNNK